MKLGERFICTHKLVRKRQYKNRSWERQKLYTPIEVMVVGKRTLSDGSIYIEEGVKTFEPSKTFQAIKVAPNLQTDFLCLATDLTSLP